MQLLAEHAEAERAAHAESLAAQEEQLLAQAERALAVAQVRCAASRGGSLGGERLRGCRNNAPCPTQLAH